MLSDSYVNVKEVETDTARYLGRVLLMVIYAYMDTMGVIGWTATFFNSCLFNGVHIGAE